MEVKRNMEKRIRIFENRKDLISFQINITNRCINKCIGCRKYLWPQIDFDFDVIKNNILPSLKSLKTETVTISGGEPFLHKDIYKICDLFHKNNLESLVITSGVIPIEFKKLQSEKIAFSLDTIDEERYRIIRGPGKLSVLLDNINSAMKSDKKIQIYTTISNINEDEVVKLKEFVNNLKTEYNNIKHLISYMHTHRDVMSEKTPSSMHIKKYCFIVYNHCIIDANGDVFPCCVLLNDNDYYKNRHTKFILGNVIDNSLQNVWESKKAKKIKDYLHSHRPLECFNCNRYPKWNKIYNEYMRTKKEKIFL